jgi:2-phospho-L-lactate guanylyltransferase (CobY/MobA/RfbA family)
VRPRTSILIPVKATGRAKRRLADLLDPATRQELALTMLEDVLAAAGLVMGKLERIPVVRIRGYRSVSVEGRARALVRPADRDLFR